MATGAYTSDSEQRPSSAVRIAVVLALMLLAAHASAPAGGMRPNGGDLSSGRVVIAAGGGTSSGGNFAIDGTIGQADVDPLQPSTGGVYSISGGFWFTASPATDTLFANGFEQQL